MTSPTDIPSTSSYDRPSGLPYRRSLYALLIAISTAVMLARVARVDSTDPKSQTPFLSANDRSRWATIRSLGDDGTYSIDHVIFDEKGNRVRGWHTIDLVKHRGQDGQEHYYSSKPTLLTTLLAGEYWLIKQITGASLADQPAYISRIMLVLSNVLPIALALWLLSGLIEQFGQSDWGRVFTMAAACFGTFITTFAVTLNNHSVAAISLAVALAVTVPILSGTGRAWWRFFAAGLSFAFLAANELPALALFALATLLLAWISPLRTLAGFVPAALAIAAASFGTNILAHGDWRTPYAHRADGPLITSIADELAVPLNEGTVPPELITKLTEHQIQLSDQAQVSQRVPGDRWMVWDPSSRAELVLQRTPEGSRRIGIDVRQHDNWYDYAGSYWLRPNLRGIDIGEESTLIYALNCLIGHHGLFSLTPLWLLSLTGCSLWLAKAKNNASPTLPLSQSPPPASAATGVSPVHVLAIASLLTTTIILTFYLTRPQIDRNYGGGTCCLRWLIWLTPLWLLTLLPAADWLSNCRYGRAIAIVLLAASVFSATYASDNPWSHPWIFDYWTSMGWINY